MGTITPVNDMDEQNLRMNFGNYKHDHGEEVVQSMDTTTSPLSFRWV